MSPRRPARSSRPAPARPPARAARTARPWLVFVVLALVTLAAYQPAWRGGMLWDDDMHLTPLVLASWTGLGKIWTDVTLAQQYYPVANTAFWVMNRLWGHDPLGYHVVNILLHALSAFLLWGMLRRWSVPGAVVAAAVFALHPVQVESVAWMTELKNTLSGAFYFLAATAYLRFDDTRKRRWYAAAFVLFVLALGSKTVTATLPAALSVVFLVAARTDRVATRCVAARADVRRGHRRGRRHGLARGGVGWRQRCFVRPDGRRTHVAGQPSGVVLRWQALLARAAHLQLSPLVNRSGRVVAVLVSGRAGRFARGIVDGAPLEPRTAGRRTLVPGHAAAGAGLRQRVSLPIFVRRRSLFNIWRASASSREWPPAWCGSLSDGGPACPRSVLRWWWPRHSSC
jgi:hypothetical protein